MTFTMALQLATLFISICILVINIIFSRKEKSRQYLLENIIKQRNYDMLLMRELSSQISAMTDPTFVEIKIKDNNYIIDLITLSKKMDFLLKRVYFEDKEVLDIKENLISYIIDFHNKPANLNINQLKLLHSSFQIKSALFNFVAWQCIKKQATGKQLKNTEFSKLYEESRSLFTL